MPSLLDWRMPDLSPLSRLPDDVYVTGVERKWFSTNPPDTHGVSIKLERQVWIEGVLYILDGFGVAASLSDALEIALASINADLEHATARRAAHKARAQTYDRETAAKRAAVARALEDGNG